MGEIGGIAEADQLHCDIFVGNAARDGGVWGGQNARGADTRTGIAEWYPMRMIRDHRCGIDSIPARLYPVFAVAIALG